MEEENQVFGNDAETISDFDSEEKFSIYHKDKEDIEKNIRNSAKELEDLFDSVIQDVPEPSEEEVRRGIEKILERAYPKEKTNKSKKVTLKVLFIAALLSIALFSGLIVVVGNSHNISIENGFVTFAKDTVKVVFFGEDEEERIDVKTLLEDLSAHGYENVLIPQKLEEYKSSLPEYFEGTGNTGSNYCVTFELYNSTSSYTFRIDKDESSGEIGRYFEDLSNAETITVDDMRIYIFKFENDYSFIRFENGIYEYVIYSDISMSEMISTAQTIVKTEE